MASRLVQLLREACERFSAQSRSFDDVLRLQDTIQEVMQLNQDDSAQWGGHRELQREVLALAELVTKFNAELAPQTTAADQMAAGVRASTAVSAAFACIALACKLDLEEAHVFRVSCAAGVFFDAGPWLLQRMSQVSRQGGAAGGTVGWVIQQGGANCGTLACTLLTAVKRLLTLFSEHPRAAAACAGSTARPGVLLPWLATITAALDAEPGDTPTEHAFDFSSLVSAVLDDESPVFARHQAAMAGSSDVQQQVVDFLLDRCLPALAAAAAASPADLLRSGRTQQLLSLLMRALQPACLQPALTHRLLDQLPLRQRGQRHGRRSCKKLLQLAAGILHALPANKPADVPVEELAYACHGVVALLATLWSCAGQEQFAEVAAPAGAQAQPATASGSSGDGSGGSSSSGGSSDRAAPSPLPQHQAAWQLVQLFPHLAAVIRALAADSQCGLARIGIISLAVAGLLTCTEHLQFSSCDLAQLQAWARAAQAGLELQPLLSELEGSRQQVAPEQAQEWDPACSSCFVNLSSECLHLAALDLAMPDPGSSGAKEQEWIARQLWRLHSTACRLAHWRAAQGGRALACEAAAAGCELLLHGVDRTFLTAFCFASSSSTPGHDPDTPGCEASLCAAHAAAVAALAEHAAGPAAASVEEAGAAADDGSALAWNSFSDHLPALVCVAAKCPFLVAPASLDSLQALLAALPQGTAPLSRLHALAGIPSARWNEAEECCGTRLAAALVSRGLLGQSVEACAELGAALYGGRLDGATDPACECCSGTPLKLLDGCRAALASLAGAARALPSEAGAVAALAAAAGEDEQQFSDALRSAVATLTHGTQELSEQQEQDRLPLQAVAQRLQALLPAAAVAASALHRSWERPEQVAEARLQLARAAVLRSCANLRCPNVGLEGGPEAGRGKRCKLCAGCHKAFFCSPQCQRAAWRCQADFGGHRAACAALAGEQGGT